MKTIPFPFRILVTGSRDWDDEQELRLALIHEAVPHLPAVILVRDTSPSAAGVMAAEWASNYGIRTEQSDGAKADVCLAFGDSPRAAEAEKAGIPVRRYLRPEG